MSWVSGTASGYLDLLARLNAFLLVGHSLPPAYTGTGNGTIDGLIGTASSVQETISVAFTSETTFSVTGSVSGALGTGTVGSTFSCAVCAFAIVAGSTSWASGDTITFVMTSPWEALKDVVGWVASSIWSDGTQPCFALDGSADTHWGTSNGVLTGTLEVDFGSAHTILEYSVQAWNDAYSPTTCPKAWTLEAYDEQTSSWVVADTRSGQTSWTQGEKRTFALATSVSAKQFRINISENNGSAANTTIAELGLYETSGGIDIALACCIWQAPGNANQDQIFVGVKPFYNAANDYYDWRLGVFTGFTPGSLFAAQPGAKTNRFIYLWNSDIPYWFVADGKHLAIVARVSSVYESAYLGFPDAYPSPGQMPYPIVLGGSACWASEPAIGSLNWRWSYTWSEHSPFWKPLNTSNGSLCSRRLNGTWCVYDASDNAGSTAYGSVWPYVGGGSGSMTYLITNMDGTYPLYPIIPNEEGLTLGELTGVRATTGHLQTAENRIIVDRIPWLVIPSIYRSTRTDYAAVRLA